MKTDKDNRPMTLLEISQAAIKRVDLISKEFRKGFEFIKNYPRSVTFFGSARTKEDNIYYQKARDLAARIVKELHYSVVTGGGPGIMEAANCGAFEAGGNSLGLTIELPHEQMDNQYMTGKENFHYFFSRKVCLSFSAEAYIFFPGGFGTLDEVMEILALVQTNKIPRTPIILFGIEFWSPLENLFKEVLLRYETIDKEDLDLYKITDNEEEIIEIIKAAPVRVGLKYKDDSKSEKQNINNTSALSGLFKKIGF
ncbi:MAG: TIGR00730 family Rossman fold protein [Candidatus Zambryskibacteria bacterium]|nr:TIGR00730 family Rossman fold protein [Candidatus Zambryskibacteria bacterium]